MLGVDVKNDIAIIKLKGSDFVPIKQRKDTISIGSQVYAFGNTGGEGLISSDGIHSGLKSDFYNINYFQYTSPTSGGNSGCPIIDATGQLVALRQASNNSYANVH